MSAADEVEKLAALNESGKLTDEEFAHLKVTVLSASGPRRRQGRWLLIGGLVAAVLACIGGVVIAMSSDDEADTQPTVATTTPAKPETTNAPVVETTAWAPNTSGKAAREAVGEDAANANRASGVETKVASFTDFWVEGKGPLWAKNGASPSEVADCAFQAVYDYYDLDTAESGATELEVVAYLVLVCGGYTDDEARHALESATFG